MRCAAAAVLRVLLGLGLVAGCSPKAPAPPARAADGRYTTRGELVELRPGREGAYAELSIRHEAIPTFVGADGAPAPMASMVMVFSAAPTLELAGLTPGARLGLDFEVRWSADPLLYVTRLERLPPTTRLELGGGP